MSRLFIYIDATPQTESLRRVHLEMCLDASANSAATVAYADKMFRTGISRHDNILVVDTCIKPGVGHIESAARDICSETDFLKALNSFAEEYVSDRVNECRQYNVFKLLFTFGLLCNTGSTSTIYPCDIACDDLNSAINNMLYLAKLGENTGDADTYMKKANKAKVTTAAITGVTTTVLLSMATVIAIPIAVLGTAAVCAIEPKYPPTLAMYGITECLTKGNTGCVSVMSDTTFERALIILEEEGRKLGATGLEDLEHKLGGNYVDSPSAEEIQWCRDNAPDACKDLPDNELWDLMKDSYESFK